MGEGGWGVPAASSGGPFRLGEETPDASTLPGLKGRRRIWREETPRKGVAASLAGSQGPLAGSVFRAPNPFVALKGERFDLALRSGHRAGATARQRGGWGRGDDVGPA